MRNSNKIDHDKLKRSENANKFVNHMLHIMHIKIEAMTGEGSANLDSSLRTIQNTLIGCGTKSLQKQLNNLI